MPFVITTLCFLTSDLLKAYFGLYVVGLVFTLISFFPIVVACYHVTTKSLNLASLFGALGGERNVSFAITLYICTFSGFFVSASVAIFHGILHLENNEIKDGKFYANIKDDEYYKVTS